MRIFSLLLPLFSFFAAPAFSASPWDKSEDPRNTSEYHVLFDIAATGTPEVVRDFGAYIQVYSAGNTFIFRFCNNFEGKGLGGRANLKRVRTKLVPMNGPDELGYLCDNFTPGQVLTETSLVQLGSKSFFSMHSEQWSSLDGGQIIFRFAKKIPLIGSPTYRTLRIRAIRESGSLSYLVETLLPKGPILPTHLLDFLVSGSVLGLPNGISKLTLNTGTATEQPIDIESIQ